MRGVPKGKCTLSWAGVSIQAAEGNPVTSVSHLSYPPQVLVLEYMICSLAQDS